MSSAAVVIGALRVKEGVFVDNNSGIFFSYLSLKSYIVGTHSRPFDTV